MSFIIFTMSLEHGAKTDNLSGKRGTLERQLLKEKSPFSPPTFQASKETISSMVPATHKLAKKEKIPSFDEQFTNRKLLEVKKRKIKIIDIIPKKQLSSQPVAIMPGFFQELNTAKLEFEALHDVKNGKGYRVLSFEPKADSFEEHVENATALIKHAIEVTGHPTVSLVLVSMGGMYGSEAARRNPEDVGVIVNFEAAGIRGKQSHIGIATRTLIGGALETIRSFPSNHLNGLTLINGALYAGKAIAQNPFRALELTDKLARQSIDSLEIQANLKQVYGIPIGLIAFTNDATFQMNEVQKAIAAKYRELREKNPNYIGDPRVIFEGVWSLPGNHFTVTSDRLPAAKVIPRVIHLLEQKQPNKKKTN